MKYLVYNIDYDMDEDNVDIYLPQELEISIPDVIDEFEIEGLISDKISNITGFCHNGFSYDLLEE
mgnify:CR=1 FL=1